MVPKRKKNEVLLTSQVTQSQPLYPTPKNCIHHENHAPPPEQTLKEARHGEPEQAKSPILRGKKDS